MNLPFWFITFLVFFFFIFQLRSACINLLFERKEMLNYLNNIVIFILLLLLFSVIGDIQKLNHIYIYIMWQNYREKKNYFTSKHQKIIYIFFLKFYLYYCVIMCKKNIQIFKIIYWFYNTYILIRLKKWWKKSVDLSFIILIYIYNSPCLSDFCSTSSLSYQIHYKSINYLRFSKLVSSSNLTGIKYLKYAWRSLYSLENGFMY